MEGNDRETVSSFTVDRMCKPLYLKNNDLQSLGDKELVAFDLINPIKKIIGDDLLCVQLDHNLWRVYLTNAESSHTGHAH